ncbi:MAG: helix-turn-helix transcriptional regulator [Phycisphaerales bacterium]|nr:helix-turn-helix transcriptional regulator [Phycisphaerales bacterium]
MERSLHSLKLKRLQNLLRQVRDDAGLRQVDLADKLASPQSFVSKYESGERCLDLLELEQVCSALGISLQEFIHRYEESER